MTPQPVAPPPPQQQSWFSKNWMWVAGGGCLVLACCAFASLFAAGALASQLPDQPTQPTTDEPTPRGPASTTAARVDCGTPGPEGVDCEIKRTGGSAAFQACWDLEITCVNGGVMVGQGCGSIAAQAAGGTVNLPVASFSNQEGCDAPRQGTVKNLVVTEE